MRLQKRMRFLYFIWHITSPNASFIVSVNNYDIILKNRKLWTEEAFGLDYYEIETMFFFSRLPHHLKPTPKLAQNLGIIY